MLTTKKGSLKLGDFRHAAERRRAMRRSLRRVIQYLPCDQETSDYETARVTDVSSQGICIRTGSKLKKGERFYVKLMSAEAIMLIYVVRHCHRDLDGKYRVGAELDGFIGPFNPEDPEWVYHRLESAEAADELN